MSTGGERVNSPKAWAGSPQLLPSTNKTNLSKGKIVTPSTFKNHAKKERVVAGAGRVGDGGGEEERAGRKQQNEDQHQPDQRRGKKASERSESLRERNLPAKTCLLPSGI